MKSRQLLMFTLRACVLLACLLILLQSTGPAPIAFAQADQEVLYNAADPSFHYYGRYKPGENVLWTWPGSGFRVAYHDSHKVKLRIFAANFKEDASDTIGRVVSYKVDRGPWRQFRIGGGEENEFSLTVPNDTKAHTLDVIKSSEGQLTFEAILLDKGAGLAPAQFPGRKIEIIGDSISAGFKAYGQGNFETPGSHDARVSYGWLLGDKLGAEVRLVAITSRGLVHNFAQNASESRALPSSYPLLQRGYDIANDWSWQPSLIVINLGTNDLAPPGPTAPADFEGAYTNFLGMVRQFNPQATIVALQPFGINSGAQPVYPKEIEAAVALRRAAGDAKVAYVNTRGWLGRSDFTDGVHPNVYGHIKAANNLYGLVRSLDAGLQLPGPAAPSTSKNKSAPTSTPPPQAPVASCPGARASRLAVGQQARVIMDGRGPSPVYDMPGGKVIFRAPEGTVLKIFDGPRCYVRAWFWLVYLPDGKAGWVNEGDRRMYFIEPVSG